METLDRELYDKLIELRQQNKIMFVRHSLQGVKWSLQKRSYIENIAKEIVSIQLFKHTD